MKATTFKPQEKPVTLDITWYERGMTDGSRDALAGLPNKYPTDNEAYARGYEYGYKIGEQTRRKRVQRRSMV